MKILCDLVENVWDKTRKVDYIIPETTIREINVLWDDVLFSYLGNSTQAYSESSLKDHNKAFLL